MKKDITAKTRRLYALIIAALLVLTLIPLTLMPTLADDGDGPPGQIAAQGRENLYGMSGNPVADEANAWVGVSKTIEDNTMDPGLRENEFRITLDIRTRMDVNEAKFSEDAAVILTLDVSGSMHRTQAGDGSDRSYPTDAQGGYAASRMALLKSAVKNFIDAYRVVSDGSDAHRYVAVVLFGTHAQAQAFSGSGANAVYWVDVTTDAGYSALMNMIFGAQSGGAWQNTASSGIQARSNNALNSPPDGYYTDIEGGLAVARNLLRRSGTGVNNGAILPNGGNILNRNVILFTDGEANYSRAVTGTDGSAGGFTTSDLTTLTTNSKSLRNDSGQVNAASRVSEIRTGESAGGQTTRSPALLYAISYGSANPAYLSAIGATVKTGTEIGDMFGDILRDIETFAKAWVVTDIMGNHIIWDDANVLDAGQDFGVTQANTLTWDIKELPGNPNGNWYTYTTSYLVTLDTVSAELANSADAFNAARGIPANGETSLTYVIVVDGVAQTVQPQIAEFAVPKVFGFAGSLSFKKTGSNSADAGLAGFRFRLESADGRFVRYATSGANGSVSFSGIPSGPQHSYTLTEVYNPMPALYGTGAPITGIKVAFGEVINCSVNGGVYINTAKEITLTVHKFFENFDETFRSYIRFASEQVLVCELEEHAHDDDCLIWVDPETNATASSLVEGWQEEYGCGLDEHEHGVPCYEIYAVGNEDPGFTFIFEISNNAGQVIATQELTLTKGEILDMMRDDSLYSVITLKIPAAEIGNGPFTITERSSNGYTGWTLSPPVEGIVLPRRCQLPAFELINEFGGIRRPWFVITKQLDELRGSIDETFLFALYDGSTLIRDDIAITGNGSRTIRLSNYLNADAVLTLIEKVPEDKTLGMSYDPTIFTIVIENGVVANIIGGESSNAIFYNRYLSPLYPEFTITKGTNEGYNGSFTFRYEWDGRTWDGADEERYEDASGSDTVTINTATDSEKPVMLENLLNFTGTVEIYEIAGTDTNWSYDSRHVFIRFENGEWDGQWEISNDEEQTSYEDLRTAYFYNEYTPAPPPPPPPPPPTGGRDYGTLRVTKAFSGVTNVPDNWSATIRISGQGETREEEITGANRTAEFRNLPAGSYTVVEVGASGIPGYTFVSVSGERSYTVTVGTTQATITNNYVADAVPAPPEIIIEESAPPLAESPAPPDEEVESMEIIEEEVPLGDMPRTGIENPVPMWIIVLCVAMAAVVVLAVVANKRTQK